MSHPDNSPAGGYWAPYRPTPESPWDLRRVVHLHRRAGFAATGEVLRRDLEDGPEASVDRLLAGRMLPAGAAAEFERVSATIAEAAVDSRNPDRLKAWWIFRMLLGPDPLTERLTLMWHNHFATGNQKVNDVAAMRRQNDLFRRYARAPFGELLDAATRDPALLNWLDAPSNRKGHPNENLARELMELFTLGIGHYSEGDVKEAARALTGWAVADGAFLEYAANHDPGQKTILGQSGKWAGSDLIRLLLEHPATARRLAGRLCETFMGEGSVRSQDLDELAEGLHAHHLDIGWGVSTILRSRAFFAAANLGTRVVGPVEFVVGAVRALGCLDPAPDPGVLAGWATRIGQDLFYPPNVGGWAGGRSWLSSRGMIARMNFATALAFGTELGLAEPLDALRLAGPASNASSLDRVVGSLAELLLGADPGAGWRDRIARSAAAGSTSLSESARRATALILSSPEAQLD
jgi:uncharacterized protein (DUF1800 family)